MPPRAKKRHPFAERLVQIRKSKGLSQYELADMAGISQRMVAHYETVVTNPASNTVLRLAKVLKVSVDELMGNRPVKIKGQLSRKTMRKAKILEELPSEDQKTIIRMIDRLNSSAKKTSS